MLPNSFLPIPYYNGNISTYSDLTAHGIYCCDMVYDGYNNSLYCVTTNPLYQDNVFIGFYYVNNKIGYALISKISSSSGTRPYVVTNTSFIGTNSVSNNNLTILRTIEGTNIYVSANNSVNCSNISGLTIYSDETALYTAFVTEAPALYPITYSATNGTVTGPSEAAIGDTVIATGQPNANYGITDPTTQISVTCNDNPVQFTFNATTNQITFTMPDPT